jgi:hypothetical protein
MKKRTTGLAQRNAKSRGSRARQPLAPDVQEGTGRSRSRDDRVKRQLKRNPQRDEPRLDSVEPDDLPS